MSQTHVWKGSCSAPLPACLGRSRFLCGGCVCVCVRACVRAHVRSVIQYNHIHGFLSVVFSVWRLDWHCDPGVCRHDNVILLRLSGLTCGKHPPDRLTESIFISTCSAPAQPSINPSIRLSSIHLSICPTGVYPGQGCSSLSTAAGVKHPLLRLYWWAHRLRWSGE